ncbi:hypothetical protein ACFQH2_11575 [Natronoarchaeum sp. GCM10025703]|uniref:hypothetical protein n=1 Tax=Natronoarchaeum sp. GCM10025703 TaxID=3252685 RepID=UPI00361EAD50
MLPQYLIEQKRQSEQDARTGRRKPIDQRSADGRPRDRRFFDRNRQHRLEFRGERPEERSTDSRCVFGVEDNPIDVGTDRVPGDHLRDVSRAKQVLVVAHLRRLDADSVDFLARILLHPDFRTVQQRLGPAHTLLVAHIPVVSGNSRFLGMHVDESNGSRISHRRLGENALDGVGDSRPDRRRVR